MNDLTKGPIAGHLLRFASFIALTTFFQTLYFLVDLFFVGRLGREAIAGVGLAAGFLEAIAGVWGPLATSNLVASGLPARLAVGVGNVAETVVAVVVFTVLVHHVGFDQLSRSAVGLVIGALIASPLAARLTANLSKRRLTIGVGIMIIVSSVLRLARDAGMLG